MELNIAICDDEITDLTREKEEVEKVLSDMAEVKWEIDTFASSDKMLNSDKIYNIIFLDIEMDGLNGIETAEAMHRKSPLSLIFFVTNHEAYMDDALDNHAFRFWTKPINEMRLKHSIKSAVKKLAENKKSISVTVAKKTVKIPLNDIIYVYHNVRFTYIVTVNESIETRDTLGSVAAQLSSECFFKTHASCYVNMNYVFDYNKTDITCECNGKTYKPYISTRKYSAFNKRFKEWIGEK